MIDQNEARLNIKTLCEAYATLARPPAPRDLSFGGINRHENFEVPAEIVEIRKLILVNAKLLAPEPQTGEAGSTAGMAVEVDGLIYKLVPIGG